MNIKFKKIHNTIINCKKCPRLIKFSKKISLNKRKQNKNETYWGRPVPGFGDMDAKLIIIGLAPAAHGGTRTGRPFTGDKSGDFLFKCLHATKISNLPTSISNKDGMNIRKTYITNILKCVPPEDKPHKVELDNCSQHFDKEISNLKNLKTILTLGKVAFENCIHYYKKKYGHNKKYVFKHGKRYLLPDGKALFASYHPSPRNVNTKIINLKMMKNLILKIGKLN
mgnify:FL=1